MDKFLVRYKLQTDWILNQTPIPKIEFITKSLLLKKILGPDSFIGKFYKTFKEEKREILNILAQKRGIKATKLPKPDEHYIKKNNIDQYTSWIYS